jgi:hypothetical protein
MLKAISRSVAAGWYSLYLPEAIAWLAALLAMALMEPGEAHLFSFCPFSYVLEWCPGCGLGHAIAWLFRGEFMASWQAHPLGVPAVLLLSFRSGKLFYICFRDHKSEL